MMTDTAPSTLSIPTITPDMSAMDAAFAYAAEGLYVLPIKRGSKHPGSVVGKGWHTQSTRDPEMIAALWSGVDHGIALHCGRSGIVTFDVDDPTKLPPPLIAAIIDHQPPHQSTREDVIGRGHHLFRMPPGRTIGNSVGRLSGGWGEVRGLNGIIVVAPSVHEMADAGGRYVWSSTGPIPTLPADLADALNDASPAQDSASDEVIGAFLAQHDQGEDLTLLDAYVHSFRRDVERGESRHQAITSRVAGAMKEARAGYYPADMAVAALAAEFAAAVTRPGVGANQTGGQRTERAARTEFGSILAWAVGQALAADLAEVHARVAEHRPINTADLAASAPKETPCPPIPTASPVSPTPSNVSPDASTNSPADLTDMGGTHGEATITTPTSKSAESAAASDDELAADLEARARFQQEVDEQLYRLRVVDRAQELHRIEKLPDAPPFDAAWLDEMAQRPPEPPGRAEGIIPWEASTLVVAKRKLGKTTLMLNIARCFATGEDLLGRFPVRPVGGVVTLLNFEVSGGQIARWALDAGVPEDKLYIVNLRGRRNPLSNPEDRKDLARILREVGTEALIVDPFGRAYTGQSQNDNGEVGSWLVGLDEFARADVGAKDVILAAHAGWDGERSRGASALEDWPDAIVNLTGDEDEDGSVRRYLKAMGRDIDIDEDEIVMDSQTRLLSFTGSGSRHERKQKGDTARVAVLVCRAARQSPGCSKAAAMAMVKEMVKETGDTLGSNHDKSVRAAIDLAVTQGRLRVEGGRTKGSAMRLYEVSE